MASEAEAKIRGFERSHHGELLELYPGRLWSHSLQASAHFDQVVEIMTLRISEKGKDLIGKIPTQRTKDVPKPGAVQHGDALKALTWPHFSSLGLYHTATHNLFTDLCSAILT